MTTNNHKKIFVPPIKIQGKKTKLVPFILENLPISNFDRWVEPFMGSGVVGVNVQPRKALFADNNPHIINFYNAVKSGELTSKIAGEFLYDEGAILSQKGDEHYYFVRDRFNKEHRSLDFLFLNRSCFNGMIRFNRSLGFNVPYGHKPERFAKSYITKIVNQIKQIEFLCSKNDWQFVCQDFRVTLADLGERDLVYCDPPYIGRHVDYFDSWDEETDRELEAVLRNTKAKFLVSTWFSNKYRTNPFLREIWDDYYVRTTEHFYHLGGKEENRHPMTEAVILNYMPQSVPVPHDDMRLTYEASASLF